jgi:hypothetical protein
MAENHVEVREMAEVVTTPVVVRLAENAGS